MQVEKRSREKEARGKECVVRPKMKRKKIAPEGCAEDSFVPERSEKQERSSKRHNIRSKVSREDTRSSGSRVKEDKVRSP
jgi:hypothetical protein